ncbi:MAG: ABC transporter permease [Candidatus Bipolaricaulota bacterium]
MKLIDVALRSLRRRSGKMLLLVLGLSLGVATVVALISLNESMRLRVATTLDEYGANILIVPQANDLAVSYGGVTVASASFDVGELRLEDLAAIDTIKNVANISILSPKLLSAAEVGGRTILVAGVRFSDELLLKQWWEIDGAPPASPDEALLGYRVAEELGVEAGDEVRIYGITLHIAGILRENGSQDDDIIFADLGAVQAAIGRPGVITLAEVAALCTACPIEEMVIQISEVLPQARVTALRQAVALRMETADQLSRFGLVVSVIVVLIGTLVVLTTMLSAVGERKQEIGLMRALGFRRRHIARVILSEAAMVSVVGGIVGWGLGVLGAALLLPRLVDPQAALSVTPLLVAGSVLGALLIGLLGAIYPALQAAKLDPTTALRAL